MSRSTAPVLVENPGMPLPISEVELQASLVSPQTAALGESLLWTAKSQQVDPANPGKKRFGGPTVNRLLNEYANENEWKGKLGPQWFETMQRELPLLADLRPGPLAVAAVPDGAAPAVALGFEAAATPPALLKHYKRIYDYITPAFVGDGVSREMLDKGMSLWAAEAVRLIARHLQQILDTPESIENLRLEVNKAYEIDLTEQQFLYFMVATVHMAFSSEAALALVMGNPNQRDMQVYFSRFLTWLFPDVSSYLNQADLPIGPYALVDRTQALFQDISSAAAAQLRAFGFGFLSNPEQKGIDDLSKKIAELVLVDPDDKLAIVRGIDRSAQLFNDQELIGFCLQLQAASALKPTELVSLLAEHPDKVEKVSYIRIVAALLLNNLGSDKLYKEILAVVPQDTRPLVLDTVTHMALGSQAIVIDLLRLRLSDYLGSKDALVRLAAPQDGQTAQYAFSVLRDDQKAERNIAAAYQALALLEQLETYQANPAFSVEQKEVAYNAVMNVITNLQKQAEIRGYRSVKGQSSRFAKLLDLRIPHVSAPTLGAEKEVRFPLGFGLEAYNAIKSENDHQNRWTKVAFKKANNWVRQNPWTTAAVVLGATLIIVAGAFAATPLGPLVLAFLGFSIESSALLAPSIAVAVVGLFAITTRLMANASKTALAKINKAGLGLVLSVGPSAELPPSVVGPEVAAPMTPPHQGVVVPANRLLSGGQAPAQPARVAGVVVDTVTSRGEVTPRTASAGSEGIRYPSAADSTPPLPAALSTASDDVDVTAAVGGDDSKRSSFGH